jgi:colicin import membrane protein
MVPAAHMLNARLLRYRSRPEGEDARALAKDLLHAKRYGDARGVAVSALGEDGEDAGLWVLEGRAWLMERDYLRAQAALVRAVRADPDCAEAYRWLGEVLRARGDAERALRVLEKAVTLNPDDAEACALRDEVRTQEEERRARVAEAQAVAAAGARAAEDATDADATAAEDLGAASRIDADRITPLEIEVLDFLDEVIPAPMVEAAPVEAAWEPEPEQVVEAAPVEATWEPEPEQFVEAAPVEAAWEPEPDWVAEAAPVEAAWEPEPDWVAEAAPVGAVALEPEPDSEPERVVTLAPPPVVFAVSEPMFAAIPKRVPVPPPPPPPRMPRDLVDDAEPVTLPPLPPHAPDESEPELHAPSMHPDALDDEDQESDPPGPESSEPPALAPPTEAAEAIANASVAAPTSAAPVSDALGVARVSDAPPSLPISDAPAAWSRSVRPPSLSPSAVRRAGVGATAVLLSAAAFMGWTMRVRDDVRPVEVSRRAQAARADARAAAERTRRTPEVERGAPAEAARAADAAREAARGREAAEAAYRTGQALRAKGDLSSAEKALRESLAGAPDQGGARGELGALLLASGRYEDALATYAALPDAGADLAALAGRVEALLGLGRVADAETALRAIPEADRDTATVREASARLALARGLPGEALARIEPLVDGAHGRKTRSADRLALYGHALYRLDRVNVAAWAFERALALDASAPEALIGRAEVHLRAERPADALALLDRAERALSHRALAQDERARMYALVGRAYVERHGIGDRDQAVVALQKALALPRPPSEAYFWLGEALGGRNTPPASEAFKRYLQLEPTGRYVERAKRALGPLLWAPATPSSPVPTSAAPKSAAP